MAVVSSQKHVVGNIKVARPSVLRPDSKTDILKSAILDRESDGAENFLLPCKNGDIGVAQSEAIEDVVVRRHHIEQPMIAGPVEDNFAIAGSFDRDWIV